MGGTRVEGEGQSPQKPKNQWRRVDSDFSKPTAF